MKQAAAPDINRPAMIERLQARSQQIDPAVIRDFVMRMDEDYLRRQPIDMVATHLMLADRLTPLEPCHVQISPDTDGLLTISIVAYDYFSEFAAICGLLSAFGLDIREGHIYTFEEAGAALVSPVRGRFGRPRPSRPGLSRKKIVDLFRVRPLEQIRFGPQEQHQLAEELQLIVRLLDESRNEDVRRRVNRRLVEMLSRRRGAFTTLLEPVEIRFDNQTSATDTIMVIQSTDTPAFLYALANALAMRNIYIHKARVENRGLLVHDEFHVRNRQGQKLSDQTEQQELQLTATLIKQFTHALTFAPDPAKAIAHFDLFLDELLGTQGGSRVGTRRKAGLSRIIRKKTLPLLAQLLGASDFLWEDFLRRQHANLLPMLDDYQSLPMRVPKAALAKSLKQRLARCRTEAQRRQALNQFKDQELFRIDMKHLLEGGSTLPEFSLALTDLAKVILAQALDDCLKKLTRLFGIPRTDGGMRCPAILLGAGKLGGGELGYASDIEIMLVYESPGRTTGSSKMANSEFFERLVQELLQWIEAKQEGIFHIDVRLRPHGSKGSLANTLDEFRQYYSPGGSAAPFERQALIKLRSIAGDEALGRQVEHHRDEFVYSGAPWDLATALDLRQRQVAELVEPGRFNVKYSRGGLIDVEYAIQYLQLMHGRQHTTLRTPNTLTALAALVSCGIVAAEVAEQLREAYLFFRKLVDGLRMVRGNTKDLLLPPPESDDFVFLARRIGYGREDWAAGARQFQADLAHHSETARGFFDRSFGA
jgi:glutamate-ammonia-ligase adenylyltransferase